MMNAANGTVPQRNALARGAAAVTLAALMACAESPRVPRPLTVGDEVPQYAAADLDGSEVSLASLRGEAVMLNIWATWCPPCRDEMPALQQLHTSFADSGLHVIGVSIDGPGASELVREFVDEFGVTFRILRDPTEQVTRTFRTTGVPETYLIDRRGRLAKRWIGKFDAMHPEVHQLVRGVLREEAP